MLMTHFTTLNNSENSRIQAEICCLQIHIQESFTAEKMKIKMLKNFIIASFILIL